MEMLAKKAERSATFGEESKMWPGPLKLILDLIIDLLSVQMPVTIDFWQITAPVSARGSSVPISTSPFLLPTGIISKLPRTVLHSRYLNTSFFSREPLRIRRKCFSPSRNSSLVLVTGGPILSHRPNFGKLKMPALLHDE
jgi:hypothetical protein